MTKPKCRGSVQQWWRGRLRTSCSPNTAQKYVLDPEDINSDLILSQTHNISSSWQRRLTRSIPSRGLRNPGSWCYQNSVFQALLHAPKVVNWLDEHRDDCRVANCLACSLASFCNQYVRSISELLFSEDVQSFEWRDKSRQKTLSFDPILASQFPEIALGFGSMRLIEASSFSLWLHATP